MGMTTTEQAAYAAFQKRQDELDNQIILLRVEIDGIRAQMLDMQAEAHERTSQFKRGDVIEYQKNIGYGRPPKTQTRRAVLFGYRRGWHNDVRPTWETIKQDKTMGASRRYNWINDQEMMTARKIGIWDFEHDKFVPVEE